MLVPSTFTGWYRKMMMKAEIAREMMRSRTQTPIPAPRRAGPAVPGTQVALVGGVGAPASPAEPGSVNVPSMRSLLYTEPVVVAAGYMLLSLNSNNAHLRSLPWLFSRGLQ